MNNKNTIQSQLKTPPSILSQENTLSDQSLASLAEALSEIEPPVSHAQSSQSLSSAQSDNSSTESPDLKDFDFLDDCQEKPVALPLSDATAEQHIPSNSTSPSEGASACERETQEFICPTTPLFDPDAFDPKIIEKNFLERFPSLIKRGENGETFLDHAHHNLKSLFKEFFKFLSYVNLVAEDLVSIGNTSLKHHVQELDYIALFMNHASCIGISFIEQVSHKNIPSETFIHQISSSYGEDETKDILSQLQLIIFIFRLSLRANIRTSSILGRADMLNFLHKKWTDSFLISQSISHFRLEKISHSQILEFFNIPSEFLSPLLISHEVKKGNLNLE